MNNVYKKSCRYYEICLALILEPIPMCNLCKCYEQKRRDLDD